MISGVKAEFDPVEIDAVISDLMCTLFNPGVPEVAVRVWAAHVKQPVDKLAEAMQRHDLAGAGVGQMPGMKGRRALLEEWMQVIWEEAKGPKISDRQARAYASKLAAIMASSGQPYPQSHLLLRQLRNDPKHPRRVVILSTVSPHGRMAAKHLGFDQPYVDAALFSSDVGKEKRTNPEIYELACHKIGAAPSRCLFVDDQVDYLRMAQSVGIWPVLVLHEEGETAQKIAAGRESRSQIESEGIMVIDRIAELGKLLKLDNWIIGV